MRPEKNHASSGGPAGKVLSTELSVRNDKSLIETLSRSSVFKEYQRAFSDATGLPLTLRAVESWQLAHAGDPHQNQFCALVSGNNHSCAGCLQMQQSTCCSANGVPSTLRCSFGLNETAVTLHLGDRTIGYLQTGQVFFQPPTSTQTALVVRRTQALGLNAIGRDIKTAYLATPVFKRHAYESIVRLLGFFAEQLGGLANQMAIQQQHAEPPQITRARQFIEENCGEKLTLEDVARRVGVSSFYFCKLFKKATGINFTDYVSRVRIKNACALLLDPNCRVSQAAYQVGFQSLTHFNRCFQRINGQSPTAYRTQRKHS
jgi:AraC-like DNA-binding protein/ligand-binding sensor protein